MDLSELISKIDIVEYISQFVDLKEKNGEFWGLSPFKEEKTPSFSVRRENGTFYDFSSGIGGNVFTFAKKINNCSSNETVNILKQYACVEDSDICVKERLHATNICKRYMKKQAKCCSGNQSYKSSCMDKYEYNEKMMYPWISEGISVESLKRFDVRYDPLSNRIVYPIKDANGRIVNIAGRTLDEKWKENGLRKYTYFYKWGSMDLIYGLYDNAKYIKEKKEIILFEGCKSVLKADTWNIKNAGAILTSHVSNQQLKILISLGVRVVFALDKDVNILDDKNIQRLRQYVNVEYIKDKFGIIDDKDSPVDKGFDVYEKLYKSRVSL